MKKLTYKLTLLTRIDSDSHCHLTFLSNSRPTISPDSAMRSY